MWRLAKARGQGRYTWTRRSAAALALWLCVARVAVAESTGQSAPPPILFQADSFEVVGENPLTAAETDSILKEFLGPQDGLGGLIKAADGLTRALRERGHPFHRAIVPPQTVAGGTIRLEVITARISGVAIKGNQHFDEANIRRTAPGLDVDQTPDMQKLSRALALANQHPARQVVLTFSEGETPGQLGATLDVKDRRPWTLFSSLNNVGTPQTGRTRITLGAQHTNLFNRDHIGTFSYTTAPDNVENVEQIGLNYRIPLYAWGSTLSLSHTRSDVNSGTLQALDDSFNVSGAGRFTSASFSHNLENIGAYRQVLTLSIDDRLFINSLTLDGSTEDQIGDVRSRPITLRYDGGFRAPRWNGSFNLSFSRNTETGSRNDDRAYADSRLIGRPLDLPGTPDAGWYALRFGASLALALPREFEFRSSFEAQWAEEALISGERFGIGGFTSVRGFEERAVSGDRGARLSLELWAPPLPWNIRALWFIDGGHTALAEPGAGETGGETLVSTGLGARWVWRDRLGVQLDFGRELKDAVGTSAGGYKSHFTISYRY
jgi:hemolysin activation/secretion protein